MEGCGRPEPGSAQAACKQLLVWTLSAEEHKGVLSLIDFITPICGNSSAASSSFINGSNKASDGSWQPTVLDAGTPNLLKCCP